MRRDPNWVPTGNLTTEEVLIVLHNAVVRSPEQRLDVKNPETLARITDYISKSHHRFIGRIRVGFVPFNEAGEVLHFDVNLRHLDCVELSHRGFYSSHFERVNGFNVAYRAITDAIVAKNTTGFATTGSNVTSPAATPTRVVTPVAIRPNHAVAEWLEEARQATPLPAPARPTVNTDEDSEEMAPIMPSTPLSLSGSSLLSFSRRLSSAFRPLSRDLYSPIDPAESATPPTPVGSSFFGRIRNPAPTTSARNNAGSPPASGRNSVTSPPL